MRRSTGDVMLPGGNRSDAVDDVSRRGVFEYVAFRAEVKRLVEDVFVLVTSSGR